MIVISWNELFSLYSNRATAHRGTRRLPLSMRNFMATCQGIWENNVQRYMLVSILNNVITNGSDANSAKQVNSTKVIRYLKSGTSFFTFSWPPSCHFKSIIERKTDWLFYSKILFSRLIYICSYSAYSKNWLTCHFYTFYSSIMSKVLLIKVRALSIKVKGPPKITRQPWCLHLSAQLVFLLTLILILYRKFKDRQRCLDVIAPRLKELNGPKV